MFEAQKFDEWLNQASRVPDGLKDRSGDQHDASGREQCLE